MNRFIFIWIQYIKYLLTIKLKNFRCTFGLVLSSPLACRGLYILEFIKFCKEYCRDKESCTRTSHIWFALVKNLDLNLHIVPFNQFGQKFCFSSIFSIEDKKVGVSFQGKITNKFKNNLIHKKDKGFESFLYLFLLSF